MCADEHALLDSWAFLTSGENNDWNNDGLAHSRSFFTR